MTSSLDGKLKLWDSRQQKCVIDLQKSEHRSINDKLTGTQTSISGISVSSSFSNYIVSWGFEFIIKVWNPVLSQSRSFIGYYEGHSSIVMHCSLFKSTHKCVSIDEKN